MEILEVPKTKETKNGQALFTTMVNLFPPLKN